VKLAAFALLYLLVIPEHLKEVFSPSAEERICATTKTPRDDQKAPPHSNYFSRKGTDPKNCLTSGFLLGRYISL
jgi:hypothetical protein